MPSGISPWERALVLRSLKLEVYEQREIYELYVGYVNYISTPLNNNELY